VDGDDEEMLNICLYNSYKYWWWQRQRFHNNNSNVYTQSVRSMMVNLFFLYWRNKNQLELRKERKLIFHRVHIRNGERRAIKR